MGGKKEYQRQYYLDNREKYLDMARQQYGDRKLYLDDWKRVKRCAICHEEDPEVLQFHHMDPTEKDANVTKISNPELMHAELAKCAVLCSNCHLKVHRYEGEIVWERGIPLQPNGARLRFASSPTSTCVTPTTEASSTPSIGWPSLCPTEIPSLTSVRA